MKHIGKELAAQGRKNGMCKEFRDQLRVTSDPAALAEMYFRGIDFCLSHDFPSVEFLEDRFSGVLTGFGIHTKGRYVGENDRRMVALGTAVVDLFVTGYNVGEVFIKDQARVKVVTSDNSFVMIDLFGAGYLEISATGDSKVVVNDYSAGGSSGIKYEKHGNALVKVIRKTKKTY